jgi:hypothetical protein
MNRRSKSLVSPVLVGVLLLGIVGHAPAEEPTGDPKPAELVERVRLAISRSLPFIESDGVGWIQEKKCMSCHHTSFMIWSHEQAAQSGFEIDLKKLEGWKDWAIGQQLSKRDDDDDLVGSRNVEGLSQLILARSELAVPKPARDASFEKFRELIEAARKDDGSWAAGGQLPTQKRPKPETGEVTTMWAMLALAAIKEGEPPNDRPLNWLRASKIESGKSTEWHVVRLLMEKKFGDEAGQRKALQKLLGRQNADGGWSWVEGDPSDPSDALATGQALYGLGVADLPAVHPAARRGLEFLLVSQGEDGSWAVNSTKENKRDKAIDTSVFWGTAWATIGMLKTVNE